MKKQHGGRVDAQHLLTRFGRELLWPGYRFMGPGTRLEKRLKRGDKGINRLDHLAKRHDIEYFNAKTNLTHKWKADKRMIQAIDRLPGKKTLTERLVKKVMQAKLLLKLWENKKWISSIAKGLSHCLATWKSCSRLQRGIENRRTEGVEVFAGRTHLHPAPSSTRQIRQEQDRGAAQSGLYLAGGPGGDARSQTRATQQTNALPSH